MTVTGSPQVERRLLNSEEVAVMLGVHPNYVRTLAREGRLRSVQFRKRGEHHFDRDYIERLIRGERDEP
jgi:excisionase family DNA binding protein